MSKAATPAVAAQAADTSEAAQSMSDPNRTIPDGMLTWQIIYSGRLTEANVKGTDADIAKSQTDVRWVVAGSARLVGSLEDGELAASGKDLSPSSPTRFYDALDKCGDDTACRAAAMQHFADQTDALDSRMDRWDGDDGSCHLTTDGGATSEWNGGARFASSHVPSGFVTIAFEAHEKLGGKHAIDCSTEQTSFTVLRADTVTKVYDLSLPGLSMDTSHDTQFFTGGSSPNTSLNANGRVDLPSVTLQGLPFAKFPQVLHGEQTLHGVGSIPAVARTVRLRGKKGDMYAVAAKRPAIALDAQATWTFTPDPD